MCKILQGIPMQKKTVRVKCMLHASNIELSISAFFYLLLLLFYFSLESLFVCFLIPFFSFTCACVVFFLLFFRDSLTVDSAYIQCTWCNFSVWNDTLCTHKNRDTNTCTCYTVGLNARRRWKKNDDNGEKKIKSADSEPTLRTFLSCFDRDIWYSMVLISVPKTTDIDESKIIYLHSHSLSLSARFLFCTEISVFWTINSFSITFFSIFDKKNFRFYSAM